MRWASPLGRRRRRCFRPPPQRDLMARPEVMEAVGAVMAQMSDSLRKRVEQLEEDCQVGGDWRQFGDDPRDKPDWALEMAVREEIKEFLKQAEERQCGSRAIADARAALEAGDLRRAIELILKLAGNDTAGLRRHERHDRRLEPNRSG